MATLQITVSDVTTVLGVTEAVTVISTQVTGIQGPSGQGVPVGGTTNQVLAKASATNYDTQWVNAGGGGGSGTVTSITATAPLTGGVITTSGTIGLDQSNLAKLTANTFNAGQTIESTGNASLVLNAGSVGTVGNQVSFVDFKIDGTLKGNIATNEGTANTPLEINSATSNNVIMANGGGNVGIGKTPTTKLDVNGTVNATSFTGSGLSLTGIPKLTTSNAFTSNQFMAGNITVDNGNGAIILDASTGSITLDTGSLTVLNSILSSGTITGAVLESIGSLKLGPGAGANRATFSAAAITANRAITVPDKDITIAGAGANTDITSLTALTTATATGAITGGTLKVGTGAGNVTLSPTGLTAARAVTFPDKDITIAGAGANTDITSLTGLTTALSTAQGGTGVTAASTGTGGAVLSTSPTITGAVNSLGFSTQATPSTQTWTGGVTATLAVGTISNRIFNIRSTDVTGAGTLTTPTAALTNTNVLTGANNTAIDFSIVNASAFTVTVALGTGYTAVGSLVINANTSAQYRIYKVSTTAMVLVRLA